MECASGASYDARMSHSIPLGGVALLAFVLTGCASSPPRPAAGSGDAAFAQLAHSILQDNFRRHPSSATDLGIHTYDDRLEDASSSARRAESAALKGFLAALNQIDPATLSPAKQLDREQLLHAMDAGILSLDVIRRWAKDPDAYSGGVTGAAYVIM